MIYSVVFTFRSAVRMCHQMPPEETNTGQKAKVEGEVSQRSDYYNLIREKTPLAGHLEQLQLTEAKNRHSIDIQKVKT